MSLSLLLLLLLLLLSFFPFVSFLRVRFQFLPDFAEFRPRKVFAFIFDVGRLACPLHPLRPVVLLRCEILCERIPRLDFAEFHRVHRVLSHNFLFETSPSASTRSLLYSRRAFLVRIPLLFRIFLTYYGPLISIFSCSNGHAMVNFWNITRIGRECIVS